VSNFQVYRAVFDREIPKLVEILEMENLKNEIYRDAFITLNELVSHQENKDMMITKGLVEIASKFTLWDHIDVRREAMLLLGNLIIFWPNIFRKFVVHYERKRKNKSKHN